MATVAERSKELAERIVPQNIAAAERVEVAYLIEQALLAERRLARLEDAEIALHVYGDAIKCYGPDEPSTVGRKISKAIRAAAEKEVQK